MLAGRYCGGIGWAGRGGTMKNAAERITRRTVPSNHVV